MLNKANANLPDMRKLSVTRFWILLVLLWSVSATAQDTAEEERPGDTPQDQAPTKQAPADVPHKVGYEKPEGGLGGPSSVRAQLEEDDRLPDPVRRFPRFDSVFKPWFDFKSRVNEDYGLKFGVNYTAVYQGLNADASLTGEDTASTGIARLYGSWTLLGRGTKNTGSLIFNVDNRHRIGTRIAPAGLAGQAGYIGVTGTLFNDVELVVVDLNWQQLLNNGNTGLLAGRFDPNDYLGVLGYANPWTTFSNVATLLNPSVAFPDMGYGVGAGRWINGQWEASATPTAC